MHGPGGFGCQRVHVRRGNDRRHIRLVYPSIGKDFIVPLECPFIVHAAGTGRRFIDDPLTRQMIKKIVFDGSDVFHLAEQVLLMAFEPENLGQGITGMDGAARPFVKRMAQDRIFFHITDYIGTAAVGPGLHIHERFQVFVKTGKTVHDRAQGNPCQFFIFIPQLGRRLADDFFYRFVYLKRTFFGPVRVGRQERVKRFGRAHIRTVFRIGNGPHACRSYVDANPYFLIG